MKYIFQEGLPKFKEALKKEFPSYRFSITVKDYDVLTIALMKCDIPYSVDYEQLNHYHLRMIKDEKMRKLWERVNELRAEFMQCENRSDIQRDYFDVDYYYKYHIGKWNKPYICTSNKE